jgi:hypothetical protein
VRERRLRRVPHARLSGRGGNGRTELRPGEARLPLVLDRVDARQGRHARPSRPSSARSRSRTSPRSSPSTAGS